jgi:hypothetical protein
MHADGSTSRETIQWSFAIKKTQTFILFFQKVIEEMYFYILINNKDILQK